MTVLYGLDKPHISPFSQTLTLNNPSVVSVGKQDTLVVDEQSSRLLWLDKKNRVKKILFTSSLQNSFDTITRISIVGDKIYILGYNTFKQSPYIEKEHIEQYSLSGRHVRTIHEDATVADNKRRSPIYTDIEVHNGSVFLSRLSENRRQVIVSDVEGKVSAIVAAATSPSGILKAQFDVHNQRLSFVDKFGTIFIKQAGDNNLLDGSFEEYFKGDDSGLHNAFRALKKAQLLSEKPTVEEMYIEPLYDEMGTMVALCLTINEVSGIHRFDLRSDQLQSYVDLPVALPLLLANAFFFFCLLWLVILVLAFCVRLLLRHHEAHVRTLVFLLGAVACTTAYYSFHSYSILKNNYVARVDSLNQQITYALQWNYPETLQELQKIGLEDFLSERDNTNQLDQMSARMSALARTLGEDSGFYAILISCSADKKDFYQLFDSSKPSSVGHRITDEYRDEILADEGKPAHISTDNTAVYLLQYSAIHDAKGNLIAILETGCDAQAVSAASRNFSLKLFCDLLALFICAYVLGTLLSLFWRNFSEYRNQRFEHPARARVSLTGVFSFVIAFVGYLDIIMIILVMKQLCEGMDAEEATPIMAMPILSEAAGMVLCYLAMPIVRRYVNDRPLGLVASVFAILSPLFVFFAIRQSDVTMVCAGKFMTGLFVNGVLTFLASSLPFRLTDEKQQIKAIDSYHLCATGGTLLGILFSGYLVQYINFEAMYLLAAAMSLPLLVLAWFALPSRFEAIKERSTVPLLKLLKALLSPKIVIYAVCLVVPATVIFSYTTYIFPLIANDKGLTALMISNIVVFSRAFRFVAGKQVNRASGRIAPAVMLFGCMLTYAVGFGCFVLNAGILWATGIVFVVMLADYTIDKNLGLYVTSLSRKLGIPRLDLYQLDAMVQSFAHFSRPWILWMR